MIGTEDNVFSPAEPFTREQSIVTIMTVIENAEDDYGSANVQYIRVDRLDDAIIPYVAVIISMDELAQFFPSDGEATQKYNDEFFAEKYLALVSVLEHSGSIGHRVESVEENGDIIISRFLPEIGTTDMAQWYILIALDTGFAPEQFNAVFVDIQY